MGGLAMRVSRRVVLSAAAAAGLSGLPALAEPLTSNITLTHADGRQTAYRIMAPSSGGAWPVVLFSHGANSSNLDYDRLWNVWAARGYLVIGPNHIDTGPPATQKKVSPSELWRARVADTALPLRQRAPFEALARARSGSPDWRSVCAAGHSFGAVIAQALVGAKLEDPGDHTPVAAREPGIGACLVFSPPGPLPNFIPADAWASVTTPSLLQTGDLDMLPGFVNDWRLRLTGFPGPPDRWTIVARGVDHYFGGLICRRKPDAVADLPALEETAGLSADFLDAYLRRRMGKLAALRARAARGDDGILTFAEV
jgi:dienelactone hydrolase